MTLHRLRWQLYSFLLVLSPLAMSVWGTETSVDYNRDIRPLLSDKCYACHGPDEANREGGFRLDKEDSTFGEADSGEHPLVAGDPDTSELYQRIATDDSSMLMPPEDASNPLTPEEIERIRIWIERGAPWQQHWSLVAPTRPDLPSIDDQAWPRNEIDHFILARLKTESLTPAARADRRTLIRRVTFDLTGLPPTLEEVDAFLADDSSAAYENLVDRLLAAPSYGEHMARFWLDAVRYGDTHGLHLDNFREMWPYRDWVVSAFNTNMPFDQFTIEQLAGDLLPDPTQEQLIATGFNRCHVTTNEGGSITEEVYVRNVVDRVVTTGTVFMGATFDCTRCHDHKYDPLTMKDFYATFAFFNSLDGNPMDGNKKDPAPVLRVLTGDQKSEIAALKQKVEGLQTKIAEVLAAYEYVEPAEPIVTKPAEPQEVVWVEDAVPPGAKEEGGWKFVKDPVYSGEKASTRTSTGLSQHFFTGASEPLRVAEGDVLFAYVYLDLENPPKEIMLQWNDGSWDHRAYWGGNEIDWGKADSPSRRHLGDLPAAGDWARLDIPASDVGLKPGAQINGWAFTQFDGTVYWDKAGIVTKAEQKPIYDSLLVWQRDQRAAADGALPGDVKKIIALEEAKRTEAQKKRLLDYFVEYVHVGTRDVFDSLHKETDEANASITKLENGAATTLVFREKKDPKPSYLLNRGEYDQQQEQVDRATPAAMPAMPDGAPLNRLGYAQWLVAPVHPRTARVTVNRLWQQVFGIGIVKTAEDFGSQGEMPRHPQLLDWLAVEFRESGWDVKHVMKRIVMSATYQQDSAVTPELVERDPRNRLLARGPRFRLDAEMLRDQALVVGDLLVTDPGGPSVKPPQPDGLWFAVGYSGSNTVRFAADKGVDKVHRRTLYTFIKRTSPPPQLSTFDAPSREACQVRRERTNTPLQALLLMNDPQYVEAACGLAQRSVRDGGDDPQSCAATMFRRCTARTPSADELAEMVGEFEDHRRHYAEDLEAAEQLIAVGGLKVEDSAERAALAAWTMVANLVLNLDEVVTKN